MKGKKRRGNPGDVTVSGVDLSQLERLLAFMSQHGLEEFEYSHGDLRIRLKKPAVNSNPPPQRLLTAPDIVVAGPAPPAPVAPGAAPAAETFMPSLRAEELHIIKSPIVGTYYASPSPGAEPFVKVGDSVEMGQVVCIIEAMKLMNEIEADDSGEVMRIFVENGQPVEYGEPLFAIRPSRKK